MLMGSGGGQNTVGQWPAVRLKYYL